MSKKKKKKTCFKLSTSTILAQKIPRVANRRLQGLALEDGKNWLGWNCKDYVSTWRWKERVVGDTICRKTVDSKQGQGVSPYQNGRKKMATSRINAGGKKDSTCFK
jgi:uncharacterized membrane-anchored protein